MYRNFRPKEIDIEKLRQELFEVRVDVKSYIKSFKILVTSVLVLLTVVAYFGYDKIDTIQNKILADANSRLAITDSILANIDQTKLDSLNAILKSKEIEYKTTIENFENVLAQNKKLEQKLLKSLEVNETIEYQLSEYFVDSHADYCEIKSFGNKFKKDDFLSIYLIFNQNFNPSNLKFLFLDIVRVKSDKNYTQIKDLKYKSAGKFNKLGMKLNIPKGKFLLSVGFVKKENDEYTFYRLQKNIEII